MGMFGAPTAFGDDAERAVRAALAVRDRVRAIDEADPQLDLKIRVAVNTGEALVVMNARAALGEAMVTGDVVNTAARLQTAAPIGGILVGEETYRATRAAIVYTPASGPREGQGASGRSVGRGQRGARPGRTRAARGARRAHARARSPERDVGPRRGRAHPQLVTVIGPAGIGKTRLGVEFAGPRRRPRRARRARALASLPREHRAALSFQLKQLCGIFENDTVESARQKLEAASRRCSCRPSRERHRAPRDPARARLVGPVTDRERLSSRFAPSSRRSPPTGP